MNKLQEFYDDVIKFFEEGPYRPTSGGFLGYTGGIFDKCCPVAVESVKNNFEEDDYIKTVMDKYGFEGHEVWKIVYGVDNITIIKDYESDQFWLIGQKLRNELGLNS